MIFLYGYCLEVVLFGVRNPTAFLLCLLDDDEVEGTYAAVAVILDGVEWN
jgi:hypothetical protein